MCVYKKLLNWTPPGQSESVLNSECPSLSTRANFKMSSTHLEGSQCTVNCPSLTTNPFSCVCVCVCVCACVRVCVCV